jgi:glyoxylase I family protein
MLIQDLHHIALRVRNVEAAAKFYGEILGLQEDRRFYLADKSLRSIWLKLSGNALLMLEAAGEGSHGECGWYLVAFKISDRQATLKHLARHQVPVESETEFTLYIRDPEGNRIGLSHWPRSAS